MDCLKTKIIFIRHGDSTGSASDIFCGSIDAPLHEKGVLQAQKVSRRLIGANISAIYSSPMKRTIATSNIIAEHHPNVKTFLTETLKEVDHGKWEGLSKREVIHKYPEEYREWEADPFTFAPQDGESGLGVLNRAMPSIRDIVAKHPGETVAVVSHKAAIRLLIGCFLGFDLRKYRDNLDLSPCSLSIVEFHPNPFKARLLLFNDTAHFEFEEHFPHGYVS